MYTCEKNTAWVAHAEIPTGRLERANSEFWERESREEEEQYREKGEKWKRRKNRKCGSEIGEFSVVARFRPVFFDPLQVPQATYRQNIALWELHEPVYIADFVFGRVVYKHSPENAILKAIKKSFRKTVFEIEICIIPVRFAGHLNPLKWAKSEFLKNVRTMSIRFREESKLKMVKRRLWIAKTYRIGWDCGSRGRERGSRRVWGQGWSGWTFRLW